MFERLKAYFRPAPDDVLSTLTGPAAVHLHATVASPRTVVNPLSDLASAFSHIDFYVEIGPNDGRSQHGALHFYVGSGSVGGDLVLEAQGLRIRLPARRFQVEFAGAVGHGVPLTRPLPPALAHIANAPAATRGTLFYNELTLSPGELVELVATVAPVRTSEGYRAAAGANDEPFVACPDLAPVLVRSVLPSF